MTPHANHPPTINVLAGGTPAALAENTDVAANDVTLYIDVAHETARRNIADGVITVPLGRGETLTSLAEDAEDPILRALRDKYGNIPSSDGYSATLKVGGVGSARHFRQSQFARQCISARNALFQKRGARVPRALSRSIASLCGGTGAASIDEGARKLNSAFLKRDVPLHAQHFRFGSLTFDGNRTDDRPDFNASAALAQKVHNFLKDPPRRRRFTEELILAELPPCGRDELLRDYYVMTFFQANTAQPVFAARQAEASNDAFASDLGRVSLLQIGWFNQLKPSVVAECAYQAYLPKILALKTKQQAATVVKSVVLETTTIHVPCANEHELSEMAAAGVTGAMELLATALVTGRKFRATGVARLIDGNMKLADLSRTFADSYASFRKFAEGIALASALKRELLAKRKDLERKFRAAKFRLALETAKFLLHVGWSWGRGGMLKRLVASARLIQKKKKSLKKRLRALRAAAIEVTKLLVLLQLVRRILKRLRVIERRQWRTLRRLERVLMAFPPRRLSPPAAWPVEMLSLDDAFPKLVRLNPNNELANKAAIARLATFVTAPGLKEILGAGDDHQSSLAECIVSSADAPVEGPHWGNLEREYQRTFFVLPPVRPGLLARIRDELGAARRELTLASAESLSGGITAVRIRSAVPLAIAAGGLEEIFTTMHRTGLRHTLREPELYYPKGLAAPKWVAQRLGAPSTNKPRPSSSNGQSASSSRF